MKGTEEVYDSYTERGEGGIPPLTLFLIAP